MIPIKPLKSSIKMQKPDEINKTHLKDVLDKDYLLEYNKDIMDTQHVSHIKKINKTELNKLKENPKTYIANLNKNELVRLIQDLNYDYYMKGISLVSDDLYDHIKEELKERAPKHPLLTDIGVSDGIKGPLPIHMSSMDKIKSDESTLNNWLKRFNNNKTYIVSDKLDGISGLLYCKDLKIYLYTRGDNKGYAQDVSHLLPYIISSKLLEIFKKQCQYAIRGELIISKSNFNKIIKSGKYGNNIKNVRNIVAGVFNSKRPDLDIADYIDFVTYEMISLVDKMSLTPEEQFKQLKEMGYEVTYNIKLNKNDITTDKLSDVLIKRRKDSPYDIDGIILSYNDVYNRVTDGNPKYAVAFKDIKTMDSAEVMVIQVNWDYTKDKIQPVILYNKVNLGGAMYEKATATNGNFIYKHKIGPGSKVLIIRSGGVIPKIEKVLSLSENNEPSMPNTPYIWDKNHIEIIPDIEKINNESKDRIKFKTLEYFVKQIGFDHLGPGTLKKLYDNDINTINKLHDVTKKDLLKIEGIKDKSASKLIESIHKGFDELTCIKLMSATNVFGRGMGEKKLKLIVDKYPDILIDNGLNSILPSIEQLIEIQGIEEITAGQFVKGFSKYQEFLREHPNILCKTTVKLPIVKMSNKFKDLKVVFTGIRDKELEHVIETNGGMIKSRVSQDVNIVVAKDPESSSSKLVKAKQLEIRIMSMKEFKDKYNM